MKGHIIAGIALTILILVTAYIAHAGDDPSIRGRLRADITTTMQEFIEQNTVANRFIIYDAAAGELKRLKLDKLHNGIIKKGDFFVSCADFTDDTGNKYDIDFLVGNSGKGLIALEAVVHSKNSKKRVYHVEDIVPGS